MWGISHQGWVGGEAEPISIGEGGLCVCVRVIHMPTLCCLEVVPNLARWSARELYALIIGPQPAIK